MSQHVERSPAEATQGVERLLGMAAADEAFRRALHDDVVGTAAASGVALGATERAMLAGADASTLDRLIDGIGGALRDNDRRDFMRLAGVALITLAGGTLAGCPDGKAPTPPTTPTPGTTAPPPQRPFPNPGKPAGVRPDRPVPRPGTATGVQPDPHRYGGGIGGLTTSRPQPIGGAMADKPGSGSGSGTAKPKPMPMPKPKRPVSRGIRPDRPRRPQEP